MKLEEDIRKKNVESWFFVKTFLEKKLQLIDCKVQALAAVE